MGYEMMAMMAFMVLNWLLPIVASEEYEPRRCDLAARSPIEHAA